MNWSQDVYPNESQQLVLVERHRMRIVFDNYPSLASSDWHLSPSGWMCYKTHITGVSRNPCCPPVVCLCLGLLDCSAPASEPSLLKAQQLADRVVCHNVIGILCQRDAWETQVWGGLEQQLVPLFLDKLPWRAAVKDKGKFIIKPNVHPHPFST